MRGIDTCLPLSRAYDDKRLYAVWGYTRVDAIGVLPRLGAERRLPAAQLLPAIALALARRGEGSLPRTG